MQYYIICYIYLKFTNMYLLLFHIKIKKISYDYRIIKMFQTQKVKIYNQKIQNLNNVFMWLINTTFGNNIDNS